MFKLRKKHSSTSPQDIANTISDKAIGLRSSSSKHFTRYFTRRTDRIFGVRRFAIGWVVLALGLCLTSSYAAWGLFSKSRTQAPASGGMYVEGMVGKINNLNPLFSNGNLDETAEKLMFNGLLRYDNNGSLAPDIAKSWSVSKDGTVYTVKMRKDVLWQDKKPVTSKDVSYTIKAIQNPATRTSLYSSWQDKSVKVVDKYTVQFKLNSPSAPFVDALTFPILPSHLLEEVPAEQLRTASYNNAPVGTGPFRFNILRTTNKGQQLELSAHATYFKSRPKLDRFMLAAYLKEDDLVKDLKNKEITSAVDLNSDSSRDFENNNHIRTIQYPLRNGVFAFFKTSSIPLNDIKLRQALVYSINRRSLLDIFQTRYLPLKTPLLSDQVGFSAKFSQSTNIKKAKDLLNQSGWKLKDGVRIKGGKKLEIKLVTLDSPEYKKVVEDLQRQWHEVGVTIKPELLTQDQLDQTAISAHEYDILLIGISIGSDPDVFGYWHSSQAIAGGRNFSEWKDSVADLNLETGRSKLDPVLRAARYQAFEKEWQDQAPALALYQPYMNYSYNQNAQGFKIFPLSSNSDRLTNVQDWTVDTRSVYLTP